jgi:hypothetical protein
VLIIPSAWGFPNCLAIIIIIIYMPTIKPFSGAIAREEVEDLCKGSFSHAHPLLCYLFCFTLFYFYLHHFCQKPKKNRILGSFYFFTLVHHVVP